MSYRYLSLALLLVASTAAAQDDWFFTDGPTPGDVTALAVTPEGDLYAGTYQGVRYSADEGQTWEVALPHVYARVAHALAVVPGRHAFVGINQPDFFNPDVLHGVVRVYPLDGSSPPGYPDGAWGAAHTEVHDVVTDADGRGWAAIGGEVFTYAPATDTWTATALPANTVYDLHRSASGVLLAATSGGLYRSDDDGGTWSLYALAGQLVRAVTVGATGTSFAADQWGIVYRSDNGTTWTPISCGGAVLDLHPLPDGTIIGGTDGLGIVRTVNDGWSWEYLGGTEVVVSVSGDAEGAGYGAVSGDGLRHSDDGGASWAALRWVDADVPHLAPLPDGRVVTVARSYYGAHAYADGAWTDLGLDGAEVYGTAAYGSVLFALVKDGQFDTALLRSDDGGLTWPNLRTFENYASFALGADGVLLVTGHEGFFRSTDGGTTWEQVAANPFLGAMHHVGEGLFFSYVSGYPDALLRSTDNGLTWTNLGSPTFDKGSLPRLQTVARTDDGALVAADPDGLMRSADEGLTWEAVAGGPDHVVALARYGGGVLWAARADGVTGPMSGYGIWRSDDGGSTWRPDGLEGVRVLALAASPSASTNTMLLAGTEAGAYVRTLSPVDMEGGTPAADLPDGYALSAVYPNPFNPSARFTLEVTEAQAVTVAVFDALGRRVAVLHDGRLEAGPAHVFTLGGASLPSGVYVIRTVGETFTAARRATLVR